MVAGVHNPDIKFAIRLLIERNVHVNKNAHALLMVAHLPILKIFYVAVRQLSKPISNWLKERAKKHNFVKQNFLIPMGRCELFLISAYHICEQTIRLGLLGYSRSSILPVSDAQAIETGAEITGEAFIFGIALLYLLYEYKRSKDAYQKKEDELNNKIQEMDERLMVAEKTICLQSYCISSLRESQNDPTRKNR